MRSTLEMAANVAADSNGSLVLNITLIQDDPNFCSLEALANQSSRNTCDTEYHNYSEESVVLVGFVTPYIILFGLIANALNFRIFTHKFMRVSLLNWYLAVLSLSDTIILITGFFFMCLPRIGEYNANFGVVSFCNRISPVNYAAGLVAQTASVWLTILMSTHRFVGVCLPFKTATICTKRNCRAALIGVLLFAVLFNITRWWEVTTNECFKENINYTLIEPMATTLRKSKSYTTAYVVWAYFIAMFLLPFLLLICLNTAVILAIRNTSKLHYEVSIGTDANGAFKKKKEIAKETSTSIMLVGVVVVFLICNTLAFVVNMLELIDSFNDECHKQFIYEDFFPNVVDASNVLVMLNASINIFVYCSFSEKFRLLLKHYLTFSCFNGSEPLTDTTLSTHA